MTLRRCATSYEPSAASRLPTRDDSSLVSPAGRGCASQSPTMSWKRPSSWRYRCAIFAEAGSFPGRSVAMAVCAAPCCHVCRHSWSCRGLVVASHARAPGPSPRQADTIRSRICQWKYLHLSRWLSLSLSSPCPGPAFSGQRHCPARRGWHPSPCRPSPPSPSLPPWPPLCRAPSAPPDSLLFLAILPRNCCHWRCYSDCHFGGVGRGSPLLPCLRFCCGCACGLRWRCRCRRDFSSCRGCGCTSGRHCLREGRSSRRVRPRVAAPAPVVAALAALAVPAAVPAAAPAAASAVASAVAGAQLTTPPAAGGAGAAEAAAPLPRAPPCVLPQVVQASQPLLQQHPPQRPE